MLRRRTALLGTDFDLHGGNQSEVARFDSSGQFLAWCCEHGQHGPIPEITINIIELFSQSYVISQGMIEL